MDAIFRNSGGLGFVIGKPCPIEMPHGGVLWLTSSTGHVLIVNTPSPSDDHVAAWPGERLEMRARTTDSFVHICFRLGESPWSDTMPTGIDVDPANLPERPPEGMGTVITKVLVDADTQTVVALRIGFASTSFSHYLLDGLKRTHKASRGMYDRQTEAAQARPPGWHAERAKAMMVWPGDGPTN